MYKKLWSLDPSTLLTTYNVGLHRTHLWSNDWLYHFRTRWIFFRHSIKYGFWKLPSIAPNANLLGEAYGYNFAKRLLSTVEISKFVVKIFNFVTLEERQWVAPYKQTPSHLLSYASLHTSTVSTSPSMTYADSLVCYLDTGVGPKPLIAVNRVQKGSLFPLTRCRRLFYKPSCHNRADT